MIAIPQLVVAEASEAENVLDSDDPTESWDGFEHPLLDDDRLITLWALAESDSPGSDDGLYRREAPRSPHRFQGDIADTEHRLHTATVASS